MRKFSLLPDKRDWQTREAFLTSQDLHDMYVTPDYSFTPWLYHVNIGPAQAYIKESRGKWKLIVNNFAPHRIPTYLSCGYRGLTCDSFSEAYKYFLTLIKELIEEFPNEDYGLPF